MQVTSTTNRWPCSALEIYAVMAEGGNPSQGDPIGARPPSAADSTSDGSAAAMSLLTMRPYPTAAPDSLRDTGGRQQRGRRPPSRCATAIASRLARTACTRTPQTPRSASNWKTRWSRRRAAWPAGASPSDREQRAKEGLSGDPNKHRPPEDVQFVEPSQHFPVVFAGLGEPKARIDDQPVRERRRPAPLGELLFPARLITSSPHRCTSLCSACPRVPAPVHADIRQPCSATRQHSGSARPPETSLTSWAPAAIAATATSPRMVSMLTHAPQSASAWMTGKDPA